MLEHLLKILVTQGVTTIDSLANQLSVSPALLEQMLQDLARGGYIETVEVACNGACSNCPQSGLCAITQGGRIWRVTEKGLRAANEQANPPEK